MRVIGMMVVGAGEADRWLAQGLEQRKELVDDMILCLNNVDKKTERIAKQSGYWIYSDDREWGREQPNIKKDLLDRAAKLRPDWILPSDADELYDKYFTRQEAEKLAQRNVPGYYFAIINLWDDEQHYRHDLSFWNVRFFNFKIAQREGLYFERKRLHCGLAPPFIYKYGHYAPFLLKHYGLMKPEDRQKKIERYEKYDPKAIFKDRSYYEALKNNKSVHLFNEDNMHGKIADDSKKHYSPRFR